MKPKGYLEHLINRFRQPKRYKLLRKSQIQVEKELDLQKIIHRLRLLVYTTLGVLTSN